LGNGIITLSAKFEEYSALSQLAGEGLARQMCFYIDIPDWTTGIGRLITIGELVIDRQELVGVVKPK